MYVIEVTPLIRGTVLESLSYFSSLAYSPGTFLEVPIRGKKKWAITTNCQPVSASKTALKAATFSLRKLPAQAHAHTVPETILRTAELLEARYPASRGSLLFALLPPDILSGARQYNNTTSVFHGEETTPQILTGRFDERYRTYQSHIRTTFAHKGSVLFVVPTTADIATAKKMLATGIEDRVITLSTTTNKKKVEQTYSALADISFAKLIITTPAYAFQGRGDIQSIIIEQSASPHYVGRKRPYLDYRDALIAYAKAQGAHIILGDTVIRTEDEARRRMDTYHTFGDEVKRLVFSAPLTIITQTDKPKVETPFQLFSPSLLKKIELVLEGNGHVFLYAARRGLAPVVACVDCGFMFRCPDSHTPYSLIRTVKHGVEERWFVSSTSGKRVRAADTCEQCGSWRLRERGIGIQSIFDEWKEKSPHSPVTLLDTTTAPTPKKAKDVIKEFMAKKSGVLIGTQIALPYLKNGIDLSAIISLDAARATPTWKADESLFRLIMKLRECSKKEVVIQTRTEPDSLLRYAEKGALEKFFDDEIALREQMSYPPFGTLILLSWSGTQTVVAGAEKHIKQILNTPLAHYYTNPHSTEQHCLRHVLIRLPEGDQKTYLEILSKIKQIPPYVRIEINPERIV